MPATRDIVIIGGGHNGLVAAYYLARAGFKPLVLERRPVVGGAAVTDEFYGGFRCSTLAHACGPLDPDVLREMGLEQLDFELIHPEVRVFAPSPHGRALLLYTDPVQAAAEIARFSPRDAERYVEFGRVLARMAGVLRRLMSLTPPCMDRPAAADLWTLFRVGRRLRGLGRREMFRLLRWAPMSVADLVAEWFDTQLLRAAIAARGIFGTSLGPRSAGSSAVLLLRAADAHPVGTAVFPRRGMGALAQAMKLAAQRAGAEIRTGAEVARILVRSGAASGVVLADGEEIAAKTVVSNADPQRTFLRLIDPVHLDPEFVTRMRHYRCSGTVAKVNLALSALPSFTAFGPAGRIGIGARSALAGRIHIGPEMDYLERAFDDSKYGHFSRQPYLDAMIPSVADPSLAPAGQHVMSIHMQYAPYKLSSGDWAGQRDALGEAVVRALTAYAPNLPDLILHRQVITPLDLEETYALTGGHIFHGELALDQLFAARPLLGWARYRTPLKGLYLCGSGTHPGAGLTGTSGRNAAREILRKLPR